MKELKEPFGKKETLVVEVEYFARKRLSDFEVVSAVKNEMDRLKIKGVVYNAKRFRQIHQGEL